jgi:epoxyqueuosine reductase
LSPAGSPAREDPLRASRLEQWLGEGCHGSMEWMETRLEHRRSPQGLWPQAQSVIALGMSYAPAADPRTLGAHADHGRISTYALGADYHDVVKRALKALARWLVAEVPGRKSKSSSIPPRSWKNRWALPPGSGGRASTPISSAAATDRGSFSARSIPLPLPADTPHADRCGSCSACQDACPTGLSRALSASMRGAAFPISPSSTRPVPEDLRAGLGNRIYGCDDCLAACPWNSFAQAGAANRAFLPRAELTAPRLADLLRLDDAGFRALFSGSPIKRIGRDRFVRNCLYAAGNSRDPALFDEVRRLLDDPDPAIADAADWALDRLTAALPVP